MKFLVNIWKWINKMVSRLDRKIEKLIPVATNIVQGVKNALESKTVLSVIEVVKFTIPGDTDDKIIDKAVAIAREYIPKIAIQLQIIESITDIEDTNDQMIAVVEALKVSNDEQKSDYYHELAAFILRKLADGKLTLGEAGSIVEYHYQNHIKKQKP